MQPSTPRSLARAAYRAAAGRPSATLPVVAVASGCGLLVGTQTDSATWGAVTVVAVLLASALSRWLRAEQLGRALVGRGYQPGATVCADWDDDTVTVTTPTTRARHNLFDVAWVRQTTTASTFYLRRPRLLLVLPSALVVDDAIRRTQASAIRHAAVSAQTDARPLD